MFGDLGKRRSGGMGEEEAYTLGHFEGCGCGSSHVQRELGDCLDNWIFGGSIKLMKL